LLEVTNLSYFIVVMKNLLIIFGIIILIFGMFSSTAFAQNIPAEEVYVTGQVNDVVEEKHQIDQNDLAYDPVKGILIVTVPVLVKAQCDIRIIRQD